MSCFISFLRLEDIDDHELGDGENKVVNLFFFFARGLDPELDDELRDRDCAGNLLGDAEIFALLLSHEIDVGELVDELLGSRSDSHLEVDVVFVPVHHKVSGHVGDVMREEDFYSFIIEDNVLGNLLGSKVVERFHPAVLLLDVGQVALLDQLVPADDHRDGGKVVLGGGDVELGVAETFTVW